MKSCAKFTTCKLTFTSKAAIILLVALLINIEYLFVNAGSSTVNNDDLYRLLNVSKTATTKQIRMAFKKIALEKHPDKNLVDIFDLNKQKKLRNFIQ